MILVTISGIGIGAGLALAVIPALFGGVTLGGFLPLMAHMGGQENPSKTARTAARHTAAHGAKPPINPESSLAA